METIYKEIIEQHQVRENLSKLRQLIKEESSKNQVSVWVNRDRELLLPLLSHEDPKTRRNIALLFGDVQCQEAKEAIFEAYEKEQTLFVRGSYLTALGKLNMEDMIPCLKQQVDALMKAELNDDNRKHVEEELRELRKIIINYEGIVKHTFQPKGKKVTVILLVPKNLRETVKRSITCGLATIHPLGVQVETEDLLSLLQLRTYKEILFPLEAGEKGFVSAKPQEAAQELYDSNLLALLASLHKEDGPFYYRVECKGSMTLEERSAFTKKLSARLETLSSSALINSTSDYEVELRLIENKTGAFFAAVKLYTIKQKRFAYRKEHVAASIQPYMAALLMELAESYLEPKGQILDPFCGVGTMLVERDLKVPAKEIYGIDTFAEAIEKGRRNAKLAGEKINFIHRDYFDFKHDYLFDEIITNMPVRGKQTTQQMRDFYQRFYKKSATHLQKNGYIIMYTNEYSIAKSAYNKEEYEIVKEICVLQKTDYYLIIMRYKG